MRVILSMWHFITFITCWFFYTIIWKYLDKKIEGQKAAFDYVLQDNIIILLTVNSYRLIHEIALTLGLLEKDIIAWTLRIEYILVSIFCASNLITILTKVLFIRFPIEFFEFSDRSVRISTNISKVILPIFTIIIDQYGPISAPLNIADSYNIGQVDTER